MICFLLSKHAYSITSNLKSQTTDEDFVSNPNHCWETGIVFRCPITKKVRPTNERLPMACNSQVFTDSSLFEGPPQDHSTASCKPHRISFPHYKESSAHESKGYQCPATRRCSLAARFSKDSPRTFQGVKQFENTMLHLNSSKRLFSRASIYCS